MEGLNLDLSQRLDLPLLLALASTVLLFKLLRGLVRRFAEPRPTLWQRP